MYCSDVSIIEFEEVRVDHHYKDDIRCFTW